MLRAIFGRRESASKSEQRAVIPTGAEVFMVGPDGSMTTLRGKATTSGSGWIPTSPAGQRATELQTGDVGRTRAYSASVWAFRCANIRAGKVAEQLQNAQLFNKDTNQVVDDGPYHNAIKYAYKRYFQEFYFDLTINSYIYGESFVEKMPLVMDLGFGQEVIAGPGGMRVLPSLTVEPFIPYGEIEGYDFLSDDGAMVRFKPDEIAYYKLYNPADTLRGFSMMDVAMESVNVDMYVVRFAKKYYENGARPGIVFTPKELDLTEEDLDSIKTALRREVKGVDNWHKPLFLTRALDATLYPSPEMEDQGYLTDESRERIASAFSVPVGMITFGNARYQFSPELRKSFYEETVIPDVKRYVRWLNAHLIPFFYPNDDHELRPNTDAIIALLEDQAQRTTMVNDMFDKGAISFNERRLALNLAPIDNGDFYSLPAGRIFVSDEQMSELIGTMGQPNMLGALSQGAGTPSFTLNSTGQPHEANERDEVSPSNTKSLPPDANFQAPPQDDVLDELRAWEKKTLNGGPHKALDFVCYHTPDSVQKSVREELQRLDDEASKSDIRALFSTIRDEAEKAEWGTPSGTVVLYLDNTDDIGEVQIELQQHFGKDAPIRWTLNGMLHITMVHSPFVLRDAFRNVAFASMGLFKPELITANQVTLFRGEQTSAIVALVDASDDLRNTQRHLYNLLGSYGKLSEYSDPEQWRPHITLGYIDNAYLWDGADVNIDIALTAVSKNISFTREGYLTEHTITEYRNDGSKRIKAIQATRIEFELEVESLLMSSRAENGIDRRSLANRLRTAIRKFGEQAFRDGLEDGGVIKDENDPLDTEDLQTVNELSKSQSQYVTNLGATLYDKKTISDALAQHKPSMWFNKSVFPFYRAGLLSANGNQMEEWGLGYTESHCKDCLRLAGQRHRRKDWERKGWKPKSDRLACGGFVCDCRLSPVSGKAKGNF